MNDTSQALFDRIETSRNLPTLPHIILKLIEVCDREDSTNEEISQIINKDMSLSAKVLRMVNSAYYSLPQKVTEIRQAAALLGIDAIKNIAISTAVYHAFDQTEDDSVFNLKAFWRHSFTCATIAEVIANKTLYRSPEEAFLSGLLHDIGKLVLWVNFPSEYADIIRSSGNHPDFILDGEMRLGATHSRVGAWLIEQWHLKSFMADAVFYHHESVANILDSLPLVRIVYVANALSSHHAEQMPVHYDIAEEVLGFSRAEVDEIFQMADEKVAQVAKSLDIDIDETGGSQRVDLHEETEKRERIVGEVRNLSLLHGTVQSLLEAQDEDTILRVVRNGIQVLFDVKDVYFLLYDTERDILSGKDIIEYHQDGLLSDIIIPLQEGKSILVQSLLTAKPIDSFNDRRKEAPTIIDEQIARVVGREGFMCIPMTARRQNVGVMLLGIDRSDLLPLTDQSRLLTLLSGQAAMALKADELRRNQSKMIQSERMTAALDTARKVVHEVNSPLSIIKNYLKVLEVKLPKKNLVDEELRIIREEVDRVAAIVRGLSEFSEPTSERHEPLDVNSLLTDLVSMIQHSGLLAPNIHVQLNLEPSPPAIISGKNSLKQVFINLLKNAGEAMPEGGNIYLATQHLERAREMILRPADHHGAVQVSISDEGPGIPETIKARLYEPFISTKGEGHSGLGLSIVHSILRELGGTISCTSNPETGTTFEMVLPYQKNPA